MHLLEDESFHQVVAKDLHSILNGTPVLLDDPFEHSPKLRKRLLVRVLFEVVLDRLALDMQPGPLLRPVRARVHDLAAFVADVIARPLVCDLLHERSPVVRRRDQCREYLDRCRVAVAALWREQDVRPASEPHLKGQTHRGVLARVDSRNTIPPAKVCIFSIVPMLEKTRSIPCTLYEFEVRLAVNLGYRNFPFSVQAPEVLCELDRQHYSRDPAHIHLRMPLLKCIASLCRVLMACLGSVMLGSANIAEAPNKKAWSLPGSH